MPDTKSTKQMMLEIVPLPDKQITKGKTKPKTLLEQHALVPSGPTNTSTFRLALTQQTDSIRGGGGGGYNADIEPYQDSMLKKHSSLNLDNPTIREEFYESSQIIKLHTRDQLWKIIAQGWDYLSPTKCEACLDGTTQIDPEACTCEKIHPEIEWTKQLEDTVIEAAGRGMTIDTAFVIRWDNGMYEWFTRNDIRNHVYVTDPYRKIEEVYFNYGKLDGTNPIKIKTGSRTRIMGFLTQYSEVDSRPARYKVMKNSSKGKLLSDTLFRDCIVIQPKPSPRSVFGIPMLKIELETSAQKKYLRSYEFSYMHTGGMKKTTVIPNSAEQSVKDTVIRDTQRGVFSRGVVMNVNTQKGKKVEDMILVAQQTYGVMPFSDVNSMINEDAELSKQSIEGQAESGAMGGNAPVVNFNMDEIARDSLFMMMEEIIRDVNRVFFDVPDYEPELIKLKESNRQIIKRKATYRIAFRKPQFVDQPGEEEPEESGNIGGSNQPTKPKSKPTTKKEENAVSNPFMERAKLLFKDNIPTSITAMIAAPTFDEGIKIGSQASDDILDSEDITVEQTKIVSFIQSVSSAFKSAKKRGDAKRIPESTKTGKGGKGGKGGNRYWGKVGEGKKRGLNDDGAHQYAKRQLKQEQNGLIIEAHSVQLADQLDFVTFEGNMFASGWYKYPERDKDQFVEYTEDEIRDVTNQPIKRHILEMDHSESTNSAFYDNNIGYTEIMGFDEEAKHDITRFHIRKELEQPFKDKGIIYKNTKDVWTVDVSPKFARRDDPSLGRKRLFLKNNAVVDPNTSMPRARLTGLDTSAREV